MSLILSFAPVLGQTITWTGPWSSSTTYQIGNAVSYQGSSFIAVAVNTNVNPATDSGANWQVMAQTGATGPGSGSVTSVSLTMPPMFTVAGNPITTAGTITVDFANETVNTVFAGPASGGSAKPVFRTLVGADLPFPTASTLGGVESIAAVAHEWIDSISTAGIPHLSQPAAQDLTNGVTGSGAVVLANAPTFTGTITGSILNLTTGIQISGAATSGNVLRGNGTNFVSAQLAAVDLSNGVTGTGAVVLATSPSLVTPVLGTPTSGTLTNCTGYTDANLSVSDVTTNNVSTSAHGFAPKSPNDATKFLDGTGAYSVPAGSGGSNIFPGIASSDTLPDFTTWTFVNSTGASSSLVQNHGAGFPAQMSLPSKAGAQWSILSHSQPATPYTVIMRLSSIGPNANSWLRGLYFYDGTKLMGIEQLVQAGVFVVRVEKATNVTTENSTPVSVTLPSPSTSQFSPLSTLMYIAISNDGSTLTFRYSWDGTNWSVLFTEAVGTFITPTQYGWGGLNAGTGSTATIILSYLHVLTTATP